MPRAHRFFVPGYIWHITQRCHQKQFLLKFKRDRQRWRAWLFEARKRYGLSVLNYMATSNHVHMLIYDTGNDVIAKSMHLIAGSTAAEYNRRVRRHGAFWQDRYHATAVENKEHLARCLAYIDLNMVRAGVVQHPSQWDTTGYNEIVSPRKRYRIIDYERLLQLSGFDDLVRFREGYINRVETALGQNALQRDKRWTEAIGIGSKPFIVRLRQELGWVARARSLESDDHTWVIREKPSVYAVNRLKATFFNDK